ncbi:unnamed protein product [Urochloa decumbens]|uniref:Uncharacterized protein n=1 Tax=Urochloa decumbens TaxID=240449 RepID=A0ABC8YUY1_9POAL
MDQDHRHFLTVNPNKVSAFLPAMAAAKTPPPSTPSFFKLLKDGVLLPARNRRLFAAVFALAVAYTSLLLLVNDLTVQPAADKLLLDAMAFNNNNGTGPTRTPDEYAKLTKDLGNDAWGLARTGVPCLLLEATAGSAVWIVSLLAAVATFAGETPLSLGALLLGKARAELKGLALTVAFVYALQIAYVAVLLAAIAVLLANLSAQGAALLLLLVFWLLLAVAVVLHAYFTLLCALGVVVAAAEPGRRGAAAVARAWRLLKERRRRRRAVMLAAVVGALAAACSRARAALGSPASELLVGFMYAAVVAAVKLFAVCAITAFYYECTEGDDDAAANTEFVKLATEELVGV